MMVERRCDTAHISTAGLLVKLPEVTPAATNRVQENPLVKRHDRFCNGVNSMTILNSTGASSFTWLVTPLALLIVPSRCGPTSIPESGGGCAIPWCCLYP